ncbi:MAG: GTP-binding protein [Eubacteriales bacterium]|nr:GTP-binding protein [Eubacteriales bacterium]
MVTIDLITGFLGSGKTTFIRSYAEKLIEQGTNLCILESDHGAINVDALILQELEGPLCDVEMIVGGDGAEAHMRRFRTKLISMGMLGYERVIVEPSGIYDVDEFFDTLREEPLNRWYQIGNVFALVDGSTEFDALSHEAAYMMASQIACSGKVLLTHMEETEASVDTILEKLNGMLSSVRSDRILKKSDLITPASAWNGDVWEEFVTSGHVLASYEKQEISDGSGFQSLFYMHITDSEEELEKKIQRLFKDDTCGHVRRVKGFLPAKEKWKEINATRDTFRIEEVSAGQNVLIVIGEKLQKEQIGQYWPEAVTV